MSDEDYTHDPKVIDLTKRVLRMTSRAGITIGQCSLVHINCLVSLSLEMAGGDREAAIAILRQTWRSIEADMRNPDLRFQTLGGEPLKH